MESRICKSCGLDTPVSLLVKKVDCKGGYSPKCLKCKAEYQRDYREANNNRCTREYEKTLQGYLVRTYRNMSSRVLGILKKKRHLYEGLEILPKEDFYEWSLHSNYPELLEAYRQSGYDMKLAPSIDRENSTLGYILGNIRWITHSENSRLGALSENRN